LPLIGLQREELMAFGDSFNDIGMLRYAGIGVAMSNAEEEVKAFADYITSSNNDDGIAAALNHFRSLITD
jgi:hydroxymethylpyrimidine pyrophosphatase-like HAD family hydrolase